MKLLNQNPPPPLLTGHSPPARQNNTPAAQAGQPRFGSLPPNAISQFITDTLGVWAPKVPITRSKTQFFEDAFLELVEDGAFYFTLPVVGPLLGTALAKGLSSATGWGENKAELDNLARSLKLKKAKDLVGHPMQKISEELEKLNKADAEKLLKPIVATKVGALLGTVGVAAGFEFMIQHTKNVITAKGFKTKNFAAVAGLEDSNAQTQAGLTDPVEKAKKRGKQTGLFVLGALAAAMAAPALFKFGSPKIVERVRNGLHVIDCAKGFDISKPILAMLIGTGVASYLDAARDPLEKKETGTRLCVVVPYLLFGKEIAGFTLAKFVERFRNVKFTDEFKKPIKDFVPLTSDNPLKKMARKETLLQFDVVKEADKVAEELKSPKVKGLINELKKSDKFKDRLADLAKENPGQNAEDLLAKEIKNKIKNQIIAEHGKLNVYSYLLGALGCGLGMNWLIYKQTQARYKNQQENAKKQQAAGQPVKPVAQGLPPIVNGAFRGRPLPEVTLPNAAPGNAFAWKQPAPWPNPTLNPTIAPQPFAGQPGVPVNRFAAAQWAQP